MQTLRDFGREFAARADDALAGLHGAFSEVKAGRGRLVLVAGEAGVGKTATVRAFTDSVRSSSVVRAGGCDPLATSRPLGAIADVAAGSGGTLSTVVAQAGRPYEVFTALRTELGAGPSVLVVEDAHWADEATLDVLRMLGRRIESIPALVIVTYRWEEIEPADGLRLVLGDLATAAGVVRLTLEPLSAAAVAVLAGGYAVDPVDLHQLTSGNPFYVREVLEAGGTEIPATVSDAVLARVARVSPEARSVLEVVSVSPRSVEPWLLEEVCGDTAGRVDECLASGLLVEFGADVGFRHELARIAVEDAIGPARRRALHRALLGALTNADAASDLPRLAHHAEAAGDGEAVLRFAPAAAAQAATVGAHREAAAQYARALRFAVTLPPEARAELFELQSDAFFGTDDLVESIAARERAIECYQQVGNVVAEGHALSQVVDPYTCRGAMEEGRVAGETAIALLEPFGDSRELGAACAAMALLGFIDDANDDAIEWGRRAIELARRFGDDATLVHAMICAGSAEFARDGPTSASTLEQGLRLARTDALDPEIPRALTHLGFAAVLHRSHALAQRYLEEGLEHCAEHDLDLWRLSLLALKARSELNQGRWAEAAAIAAALSDHQHDSPAPRFEGLVVLALVRARRGDPGVHAALDAAAQIEYQPDDLGWFGPVAATWAEVAWLEGRTERIEQMTAAALALAIERKLPWVIGELLCWRRRAGIIETTTTDVPAPYALELAGRHEAAAAAWRDLGCPYEAASALSLSDDQTLMQQAYTALRRLGANPAAAIVARRLRERGVRGLAAGPAPRRSRTPPALPLASWTCWCWWPRG